MMKSETLRLCDCHVKGSGGIDRQIAALHRESKGGRRRRQMVLRSWVSEGGGAESVCMRACVCFWVWGGGQGADDLASLLTQQCIWAQALHIRGSSLVPWVMIRASVPPLLPPPKRTVSTRGQTLESTSVFWSTSYPRLRLYFNVLKGFQVLNNWSDFLALTQ